MAGSQTPEAKIDFLLCVLKNLDDNSKPDLEAVAFESGLANRGVARKTLKELAAASNLYELNAQNKIVRKADPVVPKVVKKSGTKENPRRKATAKTKKNTATDEIEDSEATASTAKDSAKASEDAANIDKADQGIDLVHKLSALEARSVTDDITVSSRTPPASDTNTSNIPVAPTTPTTEDKVESAFEAGSITRQSEADENISNELQDIGATLPPSAKNSHKKRGRPAGMKKTVTPKDEGKHKNSEDDEAGEEGSAKKRLKRESVNKKSASKKKVEKTDTPNRKRETNKQKEVREKWEAEGRAAVEVKEMDEAGEELKDESIVVSKAEASEMIVDYEAAIDKKENLEADAAAEHKTVRACGQKKYEMPAIKKRADTMEVNHDNKKAGTEHAAHSIGTVAESVVECNIAQGEKRYAVVAADGKGGNSADQPVTIDDEGDDE